METFTKNIIFYLLKMLKYIKKWGAEEESRCSLAALFYMALTVHPVPLQITVIA